MRHTVQLPKLGDTAADVVIIQWLVVEGQAVGIGDPLMEVETNKVDAEVPSPVAGVLVERLASVDDEITTGTPICVVETT